MANPQTPNQTKQEVYHSHAMAMATNDNGYQAIGRQGFTSAGFFNVDPGINVRSEYTRNHYEAYRPSESIPLPTTQENYRRIMYMCNAAYQRVGLVRSVIDMMSEFAAEGVEIIHPDAAPNEFYKAWSQKIKLENRVERFLSWYYKAGNVVLSRQFAKLSNEVVQEIRKNDRGGRIPIDYVFYDPTTIELIGDYFGALSGKKKYAIRIPLLNLKLNTGRTPAEKEVYNALPKEVKDAIEGKTTPQTDVALVVIPEEKVYVASYKKDDSEIWGLSFIYSILGDIMYNDKLKLAKLSSLDSWANVTNLWKLGDHKFELLPNPVLSAKLANMLTQHIGGGGRDIIWDSAIELQQFYPPIEKLQNFEEDHNNILLGLGIPEGLVGGSSKGGGDMANNVMSLRNLIKRLEDGRRAVRDWLNAEINIIQEEMGFRTKPYIRFANSDLHDERAYFDLLKNLVDRNILPESRLLEIIDESPELSRIAVQRQEEMRDKGTIPPKASPFHDPNQEMKQEHEIKKIKVQGEMKPKVAPGKKKKKPKESKMNGRPPGSRDSVTRRRSPNKLKGPSKALLVASEIYDFIDNKLNDFALSSYSITDIRKLTSEQKVLLEKAKDAAFASFDPDTNITDDVSFSTDLDLISEFYTNYQVALQEVGSDKLTYEQKRMLKIQSYIDLWI